MTYWPWTFAGMWTMFSSHTPSQKWSSGRSYECCVVYVCTSMIECISLFIHQLIYDTSTLKCINDPIYTVYTMHFHLHQKKKMYTKTWFSENVFNFVLGLNGYKCLSIPLLDKAFFRKLLVVVYFLVNAYLVLFE